MSVLSPDYQARTELPAPSGRVTAKDVAREAGVHPSTVSRSLDPRQRERVSSVTRAKVLEVADRLGYRPDFAASSLRRQKSMTIGVLTPSFSNPIFGTLIHGISSELERHGYLGLIIETPDGADRTEPALATLRRRRVDGIVSTAARSADSLPLRKFAARGIPVVLALRWTAESGLPRVLSDDYLGGMLAARHLTDLGHTRVLQIPGPLDTMPFSERSRGFQDALSQAGLKPISHDQVAQTPNVGEGLRMMRELLADGTASPASAVFAHNDLLAIGAIDAITEAGLRCPEDVSVIGFNDDELTEHLAPALSTVRMPVDELGRIAAQRIVQEIAGQGELADVVTLTPELVVRDSTAPAERADKPAQRLGSSRTLP